MDINTYKDLSPDLIDILELKERTKEELIEEAIAIKEAFHDLFHQAYKLFGAKGLSGLSGSIIRNSNKDHKLK